MVLVLVLEWVLVKEWVKEWVLVLEWVLVMALALALALVLALVVALAAESPSACTDICLSNQVHMATKGTRLCIFCSQRL